MKQKAATLEFLDGLRGLAALYVMIGHARWLLWEGYAKYAEHPHLYSLPQKVLVYLGVFFKFGHSAVLFFFVLSGFVIHLRQAKAFAAGEPLRFDKDAYIKRRARRIYPPLLFCMLLTYVLDTWGRSQGYSIYFQSTSSELVNRTITQFLDPLTFVGNLLFVTETYVEVWGSNGVLWSLKYEWWFYLLYIPFLRINQRSVYGSLLLVLLLFAASLIEMWHPLIALVPDILSLFFCWWLGVFLSDIYCKRVLVPWKWLMCLSVVLPISLLKPFPIQQGNDTLCAIGMTGVLAGFFFLQERGWSLRPLEKLRWLGDCSYTLYVIHFPIIALLSGYLLSQNNEQFPQSFAYVFLVCPVIVALAYGLHFVLERPFARSGQKR